jgi:hypothetical protein
VKKNTKKKHHLIKVLEVSHHYGRAFYTRLRTAFKLQPPFVNGELVDTGTICPAVADFKIARVELALYGVNAEPARLQGYS